MGQREQSCCVTLTRPWSTRRRVITRTPSMSAPRHWKSTARTQSHYFDAVLPIQPSARSDLEAAASNDPKVETEVKRQLDHVAKKQRAIDAKDKAVFAKMMSGLSAN